MASIGSAETNAQAVFRGGFAYAGGLIALLGISRYAPNVTAYRAQPRDLIEVDGWGYVKLLRVQKSRSRDENVIHVGFDEGRAHVWMERDGKTQLVSFAVRESFLFWLRANALTEGTKGKGRELPWRVDTRFPDQFAIPPAVFSKFEDAIVQGTGSVYGK